VPIPAILRDYLVERLLGLEWQEGLVFGVTDISAFRGTRIAERTPKARKAENERRVRDADDLESVELLVRIMLDRYGHLMPGNEDEAAGLLDAYLARADSQAGIAQIASRPSWRSDVRGRCIGLM
jgi:hypothetical protein